jgi:hypothetical protein
VDQSLPISNKPTEKNLFRPEIVASLNYKY